MALLLIGLAGHAGATPLTPDFVTHHIPDASPVGQGRYTYMAINVYDAVLYAPNGEWQEGRAMALSLTYLTGLKGEKIAQRSVDEMRKQGFADETTLTAWNAQMKDIFPNVENGSNLTGLYTSSGETWFFKNGQLIGKMQDHEFGKQFFNIWLGEKSSDLALRSALLK